MNSIHSRCLCALFHWIEAYPIKYTIGTAYESLLQWRRCINWNLFFDFSSCLAFISRHIRNGRAIKIIRATTYSHLATRAIIQISTSLTRSEEGSSRILSLVDYIFNMLLLQSMCIYTNVVQTIHEFCTVDGKKECQ